MNPEDQVIIYENSITKTKIEGEAILKELVTDYGDKISLWIVEFLDEPGKTYYRTISEIE